MVIEKIELNGEIGYYDVFDGEVIIKIGVNYYVIF